MTTDATVEALAVLLHANPHGVLLSRDELSGWLLGFNAYRGGRGPDVPSWLEFHRAGALCVDRKTGNPRSIFCPHAAVSVTGTIQPGTLRRVLTPQYFDSGLAARLLLSAPPRLPRTWTDAEMNEDTVLLYDHIIDRLLSLQHRQNRHATDIALSPQAKHEFIDFYNRHGQLQDSTVDDNLAAAYAKLEGYAARFALVFHLIRWANEGLADNNVGQVERCDVVAAIEATGWFIRETQRVYATFDESDADRLARELLEWISAQPSPTSPRDLMRHSRRFKTSGQATSALDDLVKRGWGRWEYRPAGPRGGAPSRIFVAR